MWITVSQCKETVAVNTEPKEQCKLSWVGHLKEPLVTLLYSMVRLGSLGGQQEHSLKMLPHREKVVTIA